MEIEQPPAGWTPSSVGGEFMERNGPLYWKMTDDGLLVGLRIEKRHCNPRGVLHGGMLMTFADMLMPMAGHAHPDIGRRFLPTITLSTDFLSPAPLGAWLQGQARVLRVTRNMVFAEGLIHADATLVARVNGIFKLGEPLAKLRGDADR
ncbi:MAG: PaaI family thioesterase [Hyphomicrobiales bacterium]|nr:PaaI family thioesterase [Hyphomicrobiales bacterium]